MSSSDQNKLNMSVRRKPHHRSATGDPHCYHTGDPDIVSGNPKVLIGDPK